MKQYKVTVSHFLDKRATLRNMALEESENHWLNPSRPQSIFFKDKKNEEKAYPLHVQTILKRSSTKFKSPAIKMYDEPSLPKVLDYKEFEKGDILQKEKQEIEQMIRMAKPFESDSFQIAKAGNMIRQLAIPINEIFEDFFKTHYLAILEPKVELIIDKKKSLDEIHSAITSLLDNDKLHFVYGLYSYSFNFLKNYSREVNLFNWIQSGAHAKFINSISKGEDEVFMPVFNLEIQDLLIKAFSFTNTDQQFVWALVDELVKPIGLPLSKKVRIKIKK